VEISDLLLVTMRWLHAAAATLWIGAALFELLVLLPAFGGALPDAAPARSTWPCSG
jgi:uncharacterized membrane protein